MRKFAEELVSLSLAFAAAYDEDLFKRNLRLSLEYIDLRARYLRLKWLMKIRSEEGR